MEPNAFHREFHHACLLGDMPNVHEAIATGCLTVEDLDTELENATLMTLIPLLTPDPRIVRLFLHNGLTLTRGSLVANLSSLFNPLAAAVLLSAGADPNLRGARGIPSLGRVIHGTKLESNLLFYCLAPHVQQRVLKIRFLLDGGVDPNGPTDEWGTPLHLAARLGNVEIAQMLLEAGADPTVLSVGRRLGRKEKTPAQVAEYLQNTEAREAILSLFQGY
ncbi:uncharacterized protein N7515_008859 [Penicillium bovifimosum]|uniref:Uncharacterized protein n=1 Tax=Penicillium bovifimosum TaxID=126998 RepID=A0A9W9KWS7_9EURO|nr:uncharacterized protein N7515_008859 [Penicillium bovifimosum]KAJ5125034.1 hypothetical protein N7515_008859 [Penicillium bovifimosum]